MKGRWSDERVEGVIGHLLQYGVLTAAALVVLGCGLYLVRHGGEVPRYGAFRGEPTSLTTVPGMLQRALDGSGRGVIQLGLLVLIATPVARVVLALFAFAAQGDRLYVFIAALVLAILVVSLFAS